MNTKIIPFPTKQTAISRSEVISYSKVLEAAWDASLEATLEFYESNGDFYEEGGAFVLLEDLNAPFVRLLKVKGIGEPTIAGEWRISLLLGLGVCQTSCPLISCSVSDFSAACFALRV
ncbi:hypothetical protein [Pseudovibrio sp. Tun.PSC04-5.I4]|uniref:hypothetical protein n=1 Tax=Pseudovibrio sp. Tun.PSC04-5.I4 TaxID=1798213 RepID=UPI00088729A8|nr:hypothetical protein [Pseudovibrio sp. Tun.PSC04-5.I4]SDR45578.1 hypothetical protein SAMN04515695_5595 [Pseudovibrio sp. Tun.PSC04-5.I4]